MSLGRKGSRTIEIEGVRYRWAVSPDSGYIVVVVQSARGQGQRLEAALRYWDDSGVQLRKITPATVSRLIAVARERGWQADRRDPAPFVLRDADELVPIEGAEAGK